MKPTPIPTKPGRWHKADTAFEDQPVRIESSLPIEQLSSTSITKFSLFNPGNESKTNDDLLILSRYIDPSNKNAKYYSKIALSWICGVEHQNEMDDQATSASVPPPLALENPFWKRICNINAVLIVAFCTFLWAFFTDYRIDKMYTDA